LLALEISGYGLFAPNMMGGFAGIFFFQRGRSPGPFRFFDRRRGVDLTGFP
jgi:hypothetical protein